MTARQIYEGVLIELNKENAPNVLLEDFNYFVNKAVNNYINKRYNIYDVNQQTTDDLRVLKSRATLDVTQVNDDYYGGLTTAGSNKMATYEAILPPDYLHILNCICIYRVNKTYKCYNKDDSWRAAATRLTADMYSQVLDNFWNKPTYKKPYYYIHNLNSNTTNPTNPYNSATGKGTDIVSASVNTSDGNTIHTATVSSGLPKTVDISGNSVSNIERTGQIRYGNVSQVRLEIRYGTDNSVFELQKVYVDYIKAPQFIRLTQNEIDLTEDNSQILEFPDYVCQEIINELVHLIMENISDQRLQTHPVVSQSIANPAQAQAPEAAGQSA